jgi:hypothetical protein
MKEEVALELLSYLVPNWMRDATAWNCRTSPTEMLLEDIGRKRGAVLIKGASTCKKPLKS